MDRPVPDRSPFPPGGSPWCQKGNVYRSLFRHVDAYVEGGSAAALERVDDEHVGNFLRQPFAASGWYDIFPMITMVVQVARMRGVSPGLLAPRLPRIHGQYLNFGTLTVTASDADHCELRRSQHPQLLVHWCVAVVHGFLPCVLECSGAKDVRVGWGPPEPEGPDAAGFEMVGLRFTIHWK